MGFGGSSLSYSAAPYSAPPPPSSSSSTLSPLAPPFTVDRVAPRPTLPNDPYIPRWLQPSRCSDDRPHLRPPSPSPPPSSPPRPAYEATAAGDAPPYFGHSRPPMASVASGLGRVSSSEIPRRGTNLTQVEPYYSHFRSAAATSGGDRPAFYGDYLDGSGYLRRHAALSNPQFEMGAPVEGIGRGSPWVEREDMSMASGYDVAFHQDTSTSKDFVSYEDLQGGWQGKLTESPSEKDRFKYEQLDWSDVQKNAGFSSDLSGPVALAPNAPVGMCYSHSSDMLTFMEGSKPCDFNSSYGRYACQNNTDRTDPRAFHPTATYFPTMKFASSSSASASIEKCTLNNINNHVKNVDAYNNDKLHRVRVSIRPKEPNIDLKFECKEDYAEMKRESPSKSDNTGVGYAVVKITSPSTTESATRISHDCSLEKKFELRLAKLNTPCSVECNPGQSSSGIIDENLSVDSPCWKGAPSSKRPASGTFDTVSATSALTDQKVDNPRKRGSDHPKVENEEVVLHSSGPSKDRKIVMPLREIKDNFEPENGNVLPTLNEEKISISVTNVLGTEIANHGADAVPNQGDSYRFYSLAKDQFSLESRTVTDALNGKPPVISDPSLKSSTLAIDVKLLVKTIHNLSGLLSSTCLLDENLLHEHEKELLLSAINNLDMCITRKVEMERMWPELFCSDSYFHNELSAFSENASKGRFQAHGITFIDGNMDQRNNKSTYSGKEKMHSVSSTMGSDKPCNFLSGCGDNNFEKLSENTMYENFYGRVENPRTTPCERLWHEVDDAVNLLKQKLHVLKSNIGDNCKQQLTKDAGRGTSNVLKLSMQNSANNIIGESMQPWETTNSLSKNSSPGNKEKRSLLKPEQLISSSINNKIDDIDASVMARLKILKGRINTLNSVDVEEQHGQRNSLNVASDSGVHENICSPCLSGGRLNLEMKFQPAHDAMSAGSGYHQWFHNGITKGEVNGGSCMQHHYADYTEGLCLNSHFSERERSEGFSAQGAGGLANQWCVCDGRSKNFIAGVPAGSSDWEHVLKEELTL